MPLARRGPSGVGVERSIHDSHYIHLPWATTIRVVSHSLTLIYDSWIISVSVFCSLHFIFACLRLFDEKLGHTETQEPRSPGKNQPRTQISGP